MEWREIYNRMHLVKCFYRGRYQISKEMINFSALGKDRVIEIAEREMATSFSKKVVKDHKHNIKIEETDGLVEFELDLFVIDKESFKTMVKTCISMMPKSEIEEILNNKI